MSPEEMAASLPSDVLLKEVAKRMGLSLSLPIAAGEGSIPLSPARNSSRQHQANSFLKGLRPKGPMLVLSFLASEERAFRMPEITKHMKSLGYTSSVYYDQVNALVQVGYAERMYQGTGIAWRITPVGMEIAQE